MPLPDYDPSALTLWIMGPGMGELVIVRAPPGRWLVVDGCGVDRRGCAQRILDHYGATPHAAVFSHPHLDHARGLEEVISKATRPEQSDWPRLGMLLPPGNRGAGDLWDRQTGHDAGVVEQVVATIVDRWRSRPACHWQLQEDQKESLGEAEMVVLSPNERVITAAQGRYRNGKTFDPNRMASAMSIRWRERTVLLGSDLPEVPGKAWSRLARQRPDIATHDVYKIAHHTSSTAIGPQVGAASGLERVWVATPFSSSGHPRFADGAGVDLLLRSQTPLAITGLSRPHADQHGAPWHTTRSVLRDAPDIEFDVPSAGFPDCYVMVTLPEVGAPAISFGPGSIRVSR